MKKSKRAKIERKQVKLIQIIFHVTQYRQNIITSTFNQYKTLLMSYLIVFFHTRPLTSGFHTCNLSPFRLITFQIVKSYM